MPNRVYMKLLYLLEIHSKVFGRACKIFQTYAKLQAISGSMGGPKLIVRCRPDSKFDRNQDDT